MSETSIYPGSGEQPTEQIQGYGLDLGRSGSPHRAELGSVEGAPLHRAATRRRFRQRLSVLTVAIAVFATLLMVSPTGIDPTRLGTGSSGLSEFTNSPSTPANTFYPYLVNTSMYPAPDILESAAQGYSYTLPQVTDVVISGVPTVLLLAVNESATGSGLMVFRTGVYSASLATQIANGTSSLNLPIQWSNWVPVDTVGTGGGDTCKGVQCFTQPPGSPLWLSGITGTALAATADGSTILAGATLDGSTTVWKSTDLGNTWSVLTGTPVEGGISPRLAIFGEDAVMSTQTGSSVIVTTFYLDTLASCSVSGHVTG